MSSQRTTIHIFITIRSCVFALALFLFGTVAHAQGVPVLEWAVGTTSATNWFSVHSMTTDASDNTVLCGYFSGTVDLDPGVGVLSVTAVAYDFCVVKIDPAGNLLWAKAFGGTSDDDALGIDTDASGNVYVAGNFGATVDFDAGAGTTNLTTTGSYDAYLLKLDANGNFIWVKQIGGTATAVQQIQAIKVIPSNGIVIAGRFSNATDFDPGAGTTSITSISSSYDAFVERLDSDGNFVWVSRFGGTIAESISAISIDNAENVYTTGVFGTTCDFDPGTGVFNLSSAFPGHAEVFASKLDINGNFVWAKKVTEEATDLGVTFYSNDVHVDLNNNVVLSGYFMGTVDFDPGASVYNLTSSSGDTYVSKLDTNGNFLWAGSFNGSGSISENHGFSVDTDIDGNVFIAGTFKNIVDFDPGVLSTNITAIASYAQTYITKLGADGSFIWARAIGGSTNTPSNQECYIDITSTGYIHIAGKFKGTRDFDPTPCGTYNLTVASENALYVTRLSEAPVHTVTSFSPLSGPVGTPVTINGTDFRTTPAENDVKFFNNKAATVIASTTTTIDTSVPAAAATGRISVTINCVTVQSVANFTITTGTLPTITSFTPTSGPVGTSVTITGTNFSTTPASNSVSFNGTTSTVTASTATTITTTVPSGATTGKITVTVSGNTATSATDFTVTTATLPTITSFTPVSGVVGTSVTITGTNFSTTPANNTVNFNGTTATATASTTSSITTTVPSGATTGKITVTVGANTATSATDFTVTTASGIVINPQPQSISTCDGSIETFSLDASGAANITYQWQKFNGTVFANISNGGGYSGVTTKDLTINTSGNFGAGDYRCQVSGDVVPDVFSETVNLSVNPYPVADITVNGAELVASPGDSYQWYQNGIEIPQAIDQAFAFNVLEYGLYTVDVTDNGCTSTSEEFIYLITGTETANEGIKIYPNPFKDHLAVELPSSGRTEIKIIDPLGRLVKKYSTDKNTTLKLNDIINGTYIVIIQTSSKNYQFKLLKTE